MYHLIRNNAQLWKMVEKPLYFYIIPDSWHILFLSPTPDNFEDPIPNIIGLQLEKSKRI